MPVKRKRPGLLSSTRLRSGNPSRSLSSRATRTIVRDHHTLRKQLRLARRANNEEAIQRLEGQITELGGLEEYQRASMQGQAASRGGDSSKILVEWITELLKIHDLDTDTSSKRQFKLLEVGALRVDNVCARCGLFELERIDLHSQHPSIKEQDFLERPVPAPNCAAVKGFDVVSLSLVLNFVDDAAQRGEMLRRAGLFLRDCSANLGQERLPFPCLFSVLPDPCLSNSRYLDLPRFEAIMQSLGFSVLRSKSSAKLIYHLFTYEKAKARTAIFKKEEVRSGRSRNNFAIVLK